MPIFLQASLKCDQCSAEDSGTIMHYATKDSRGDYRQMSRYPGDWVSSERGIFCSEECLYNAQHDRPIKFKKG